jgi:hypothetical protein
VPRSSSRSRSAPARPGPRRSPRPAPAGARRPAPVDRRPGLVPFAAVFGLLVAAENGYLTWLLSVVWWLVVPLVLGLLALAGAALVWLGRARGWLVLTVAAVLPLVGLLAVAVVFGVLGGGSAFLTALVLLVGPIGALALATRKEVRAWTTRGAAGGGSPRRGTAPAGGGRRAARDR